MNPITEIKNCLNFQTEEHYAHLEGLEQMAASVSKNGSNKDILIEVMLVCSYTYALHYMDRESLTRFVEEGMEHIPDSWDAESVEVLH